jgi:hypothetical protein
VQAPDDIKVELVEAPNQTTPIALHHVHFFHPANNEMQAWYVKTFGATSRLGGAFPSRLLPGVALNFSSSPAPWSARREGRRSHRVRGEESGGIYQETGGQRQSNCRCLPDCAGAGIAIAFFTDPWGTYIELTEGLDKVQ